MLMEHTTIKEIAGKARVSLATVSRIINGKYRRKSKTVVNIERIIEELRFSRNRSETQETQAPGCIGVIMFAFPYFLNDKYTTTLSSSIIEALTKENFSVHLIAITNKRLNIEYIENQIKTHNIRGLLVLEFDILYAVSKTLESLPIPVISIGNMTDNTLSCNVCADNYRAGCDAALGQSKHMMLVLSTIPANTGMELSADRQRMINPGKLPNLMLTGKFEVDIRVPAGSDYLLYSLAYDGTRREPIQLRNRNGILALRLNTAELKHGATPFFELVATP